MKELLIATCEKTFVLNAISEATRLDGRSFDDSRSLKICFGKEWGSCYVSLGDTKVSSNVSYKMEEPKQSKPNEGILYINVELGQMGAPNFDNRQSDLSVHLNRLIEKCIIDSRCVDLESLCIVSEEKVWTVRVDIHVLNHAGNLIECSSIAALASLAHFKRPDVTKDGEEIIVHSMTEKDPIPTVLHHYPVCVSFGFFNDEVMVADPTLLEEATCSSVGALFVVGMNSYREVCLFDLTSAAITLGPNHIYKASQKAVKRCQYIVEYLKKTLEEDEQARAKKEPVGFPNAISTDEFLTLAQDRLTLRLKNFSLENIKKMEAKHENIPDELKMVVKTDEDVAALLPKSKEDTKLWDQMGSADEDENPQSDDEVKITSVGSSVKVTDNIELSSGSEEDVVILESKEFKPIKNKKKKKKQ